MPKLTGPSSSKVPLPISDVPNITFTLDMAATKKLLPASFSSERPYLARASMNGHLQFDDLTFKLSSASKFILWQAIVRYNTLFEVYYVHFAIVTDQPVQIIYFQQRVPSQVENINCNRIQSRHRMIQSRVFRFCRCRTDNVRISWINDRQSTDPKVLPTRSAQGHIITTVIMHTSLGKHGIVLNLTLPARQKSKIIFATHERLMTYLRGGALLARMTNLAFPSRRVLMVERYPRVYLPLFITRARRELMLSIAFF